MRRKSKMKLTLDDRINIQAGLANHESLTQIAKLIMRNPSTVSRKINRNRSFVGNNCGYYPYTAQKKYRYRKRFCHRGLFVNNDDMKW